ncbi:MAG: type 4a pilus biogenesis protein PilO [Thermoanaerobaculia bacterium]
MQTGLEGKPWYLGAVIGLVVAIGIYLLGNMLLLKPRVERISRLEDRRAKLQAKIQEGRAAKQQLPRFREEVRKLELELDRLLRILPARRNTPELLRRVRSLAEQGDFSLLRFAPGRFNDKDFYSEWPIAINLRGTYHNLALFFDEVGRFSRIINIEGLRIDANRRGSARHTIGATFRAKTFVYQEPEPVDETAGAPAGGGG